MNINKIYLEEIPCDYSSYKKEVIFYSYKWDPQVGDINTISKYAAILDNASSVYLASNAEKLFFETKACEEALLNYPEFFNTLNIPGIFKKELIKSKKYYDSKNNIRIMRFDFHPTYKGVI